MRIDGQPGPTIGLFGTQVPHELLYALGCTPVRVFPTATKPTAAEAYLPRNFCALNRLILSSFLENGQASLDAVIFSDEDDATRRLHDVWRACVPVPVWGFVEVPRAATPLAIDRYAELLARLSADLEGQTGRSLSPDDLRGAITVYNAQRVLLGNLKRHWMAGGLDTSTYRRLRRTALTRDPLTANTWLAQAVQEIQGEDHERVSPDYPKNREISEGKPPGRRLLLMAELAAPDGLVRLVEAKGAQVVAEDSDLDERSSTETVSADAGSVEVLLVGLAKAYLSKPPGPRLRDLPRRLEYLSLLVAERGVQAAVCAYSKFCDLYLAEFPVVKAHLEGLGVAVLLLELEDEAIGGQHRTRTEAFLEMLNER